MSSAGCRNPICPTEAARGLVRDSPIDDGRALAERLVAAYPVFTFTPYPGLAGGYIVEATQTALHHCFTTTTSADCLTGTVNRGGSAATNGALAGMLAGARYGPAAIPFRWLDRLALQTRSQIVTQTRRLLTLVPNPVNGVARSA